MHVTAKEKVAIFKKHGGDSKNTGSTEGQIALFSKRISYLTDHLKLNRKDKNTQRSLQLLVGKRRGLLDYLMNKDIEKYRILIKELGIRR
jgi:small subunit ribosomal protein S15